MSAVENDQYVHPGARFSQSGAMLGHGQGLTLRDWFAGQCLRDTFAALHAAGQANFNDYQVKRCAETAYMAADAMLAAREVQS
jgi:hypothetical protein